MKGENGARKGPGPDNPDEAWNGNAAFVAADDGGDTGRPPWAGGGGGGNGGGGGGNGGGGGGGGGRPPGAGTKKGELFGDQLILFRDLDPTDPDGGDGEPVLDGNGQLIPVGYDPATDDIFPIYFEADEEGDYEIPPEDLPFVQEVELERANVARAPTKVVEKALLTALDKIETADEITTDPAGRIMYSTDGGTSFSTIDAPLENLALYQFLMTPPAGVESAWTEDLTDHWPPALKALLGPDLQNPDWDPSALMGAAWSKEGEITLDAMIYENTTLGVNEVTGSGATLQIDYFDFSTKGADAEELYDYDRAARHEDTWLRWIEIEVVDGVETPVFKYGTVLDAVFGGESWEDAYIALNDDGTDFVPETEKAALAGVNDWAAAADDARAVINFMHNNSAIEVDVSEVPLEFMM